jgi:hypothetical protein
MPCQIHDFERLADQSSASMAAAQLVTQPTTTQMKQLLDHSGGELRDSGSFKFAPPPSSLRAGASSVLRPDTSSGVSPRAGGGANLSLLATPARPSEVEIR